MKGKVNLKNEIISYVLITLGIFTYTFAWSAFMLPVEIVGGGVSGISSVIYYAAKVPIPIGILNLFINAVLLAIGFKVLGPKFGIKTIYGIIMSSIAFLFWLEFLNIDDYFSQNMSFDPFMCAIIGGAICGGGIGLTFVMGGNSGGTDIIALILTKFYNISPGKVIMYMDLVIIGLSYFVSLKLENVIYGYITMVTMTYVLDMVIDGNKQSYQIMVFSQKNDEIGQAITTEVGRGATLLDAEGCYSHQSQKVLIVMTHRTDKPIVMQIINRIDPSAFVSVSKVQGVYGKNFDKIKI